MCIACNDAKTLMYAYPESEINELEDAYKAASKMAAEYVLMERAAAAYTSKQNYRHEGPLPVIKQQESSKINGQSRSVIPYMPYQHVTVAYKENTIVCREWYVLL